MRKVLILNVFICFVLFANAQVQLRGKVVPVAQSFVSLRFNPVGLFDTLSLKPFVIPIDKNFTFTTSIPVDSFVHGTISYGGFFHSFYFEKGDDLQIEFNGDYINYKGKGEGNNNFYYHFLEKYKVFDFEVIYRKKLEPDSALKAFQDILARRKALFVLNKEKFSEGFKKHFELNDAFEYESFLIKFPSWYASYNSPSATKKEFSNKRVSISQIAGYSKEERANQPFYLANLGQLMFLKTKNLIFERSDFDFRTAYLSLVFDSLSGKVRENIIAQMLFNKLIYEQILDTNLYQRFLAIHPDIELTRQIESVIANLGENSRVLDQDSWKKSIVSDIRGKDTTIASILEICKGKVVYIDFWSLGCGPCREEMPSSIALRERLKNIPVVFLYISLDPPSAATIGRSIQLIKSSQGLYYLKNKTNPRTLDVLNLGAIPRYVLLNTKGEIVSRYANRPGDLAIEKQIKAILGY